MSCRIYIHAGKVIEPKFHYADFATFTETSPRESRGHKSWESATEIMSPTFIICIRDFPREEVSAKVGVMQFGLKTAQSVFGLKLFNDAKPS